MDDKYMYYANVFISVIKLHELKPIFPGEKKF